jgi:hypothetical protein
MLVTFQIVGWEAAMSAADSKQTEIKESLSGYRKILPPAQRVYRRQPPHLRG